MYCSFIAPFTVSGFLPFLDFPSAECRSVDPFKADGVDGFSESSWLMSPIYWWHYASTVFNPFTLMLEWLWSSLSVTCIMASKATKTATRRKELMQATVSRPRALEQWEYRKTCIWTGVSLQASNEELGYAGEPWGVDKWELGAVSQGYTEGQPAPAVSANPGLED